MKKAICISLIILPVFFILYGFHKNPEQFYCMNIAGKEEPVNEKNKTIVVIAQSIGCLDCVKFLSKYLYSLNLDSSVGIVVIAEYQNSILANRQKSDYFKSIFQKADKVLFSIFATDSIGPFILRNHKKASYPVVILINNDSNYFKHFIFDQIINQYRFLSKRNNLNFENAINQFLED